MTPESTDPQAHSGLGNQGFNDHFSGHAEDYASYRPTYPAALFLYLAAAAPARSRAWDCATGNGQSALALARHFDRVIATDASMRQLAEARPHERVVYLGERAESTSLRHATCDLVVVAQAVHWFDRDRFYAEVRRVTRPGGLVAVWTYDLLRVDAAVDRLVDTLHNETVEAYWPPQRCLVDARYASLDFPFAELDTPSFEMERKWTVERALGYLRTWSAVRGFIADRGVDPLADFASDLRSVWGSGARTVRWPLTVRLGRL